MENKTRRDTSENYQHNNQQYGLRVCSDIDISFSHGCTNVAQGLGDIATLISWLQIPVIRSEVKFFIDHFRVTELRQLEESSGLPAEQQITELAANYDTQGTGR